MALKHMELDNLILHLTKHKFLFLGTDLMFDENKFFREASARICSSLNLDTFMNRNLHFLKNYMPITGIYMHTFNYDTNVFQPIFYSTFEGTQKFDWELKLTDKIAKKLSRKWEGGNPDDIKIDNTVELDPVFWRYFPNLTENSFSRIRLPLVLEKETIGRLSFFTEGENRYTDEHGRLIRLLQEPFTIAISNIRRHQELENLKEMLVDDNRYLRRELLTLSGDEIVGEDSGLRDVMKKVHRVASTNSTILLQGETGVGKDVIARAIHDRSSRKNGPFIAVNCGAIPENLIDSELFGYEKGAFTGAVELKRGRFERAQQGTIFLDEIGDLTLPVQTRLLRVLQNKEVERVGGIKPIPIDIRIISATHRNLAEMVKSGQFREDLLFRLNIYPIIIPPLRDRKDDIPALVNYFTTKKTREMNLSSIPPMNHEMIDQFFFYHWPGNVRELENLVERYIIQSLGMEQTGTEVLGKFFLPGQSNGESLPTYPENDLHTLDEHTIRYINRVLDYTEGKIQGPNSAAEILGLNPNTLRTRMKKLGIPFGRRGHLEASK